MFLNLCQGAISIMKLLFFLAVSFLIIFFIEIHLLKHPQWLLVAQVSCITKKYYSVTQFPLQLGNHLTLTSAKSKYDKALEHVLMVRRM